MWKRDAGGGGLVPVRRCAGDRQLKLGGSDRLRRPICLHLGGWKGRSGALCAGDSICPNERPRMHYERAQMASAPCLLGPEERSVVLNAIQDTCAGSDYVLNAVHVRTNHVHVVVSGEDDPEGVMGRMKGRASFELNRLEGRSRKRWSRHGSTRYPWTKEERLSV